MRKFQGIMVWFVLVLAACCLVVSCIRTPPLKISVNGGREEKNGGAQRRQVKEKGVEMEMYPTGSSLPDCSYACGACSPCKRVMISFQCSVAESCSVIYRCTCKGRFYHVPSRA